MRIILFILAFAFTTLLFAQDRKYSTYYYQRASLYESLPTSENDIIMLGNSITDGCEWSELLGNKNVKNRGISGDVTMGVYDRLDSIVRGKPNKVFILIGVNDVSQGVSADSVVGNIRLIVEKIQKESPRTRLYIQSILPVNDDFSTFGGHTSKAHIVDEINSKLQIVTKDKKITYVDLYPVLTEKDSNKLDKKFTNDGLHLLGAGYMVWRDVLLPYINE